MSDKVHWTDIALWIFGFVMSIITFRWVKSLFSASDGKKGFSLIDFKHMASFFIFVGAFVFMLIKEGQRPDNTQHIYSELWLLIIVGGLLYVLSMDTVLDKIMDLIRLLIELRKASNSKENPSVPIQIKNQVNQSSSDAPPIEV